ncbi:MAG: hypothetical protein AAGC76_09700 [Luteibacter sp.]|uniref:DUF2379 family protein n=1 Tax=Luteibacter sp. TaxID=1886636 RepID=UPI0028079FF1|nr:hypothetical protein [Luteibacter sp.]MDQ7996115.1 hypothetical protein [Luteibacter sp.]
MNKFPEDFEAVRPDTLEKEMKSRLTAISKRMFDAGYRDVKLARGEEWDSASQTERMVALLDVLEKFMDGEFTEIKP